MIKKHHRKQIKVEEDIFGFGLTNSKSKPINGSNNYKYKSPFDIKSSFPADPLKVVVDSKFKTASCSDSAPLIFLGIS